MRKTGLFLLGLTLVLAGMVGTANAQKSGPDFSKLLKATAPAQNSSQGMTDDQKKAKQDAFNQAIQDRRQAEARNVQGYEPDLHGYLRAGVLICESGYIKVPDGSKCEQPKEVEGGRWKDGRLVCDNGRIKWSYLDGTLECHALPEVENGYYEMHTLLCRGNYMAINGECIPANEVRPDDKFGMDVQSLCPENFKYEIDGCYEKEGAKKLSTGYGNNSDGDNQDVFKLNPYDSQ